MIKGKRLAVITLSLMLTTGFATDTMASKGKGAGQAKAPGQSENFSKGITTVVDVSEEVSYDTLKETFSEVSNVFVTPRSESVVSEVEVTIVNSTYKEMHPTKNWYRYVNEVTLLSATIVRTWEGTTTVTSHYYYETPVTITETTTTTSTHRGAPGSKGKKLSTISVIDKKSVSGEKKLVNTIEDEVVTKGEVTRTTIITSNDSIQKSAWIKP